MKEKLKNGQKKEEPTPIFVHFVGYWFLLENNFFVFFKSQINRYCHANLPNKKKMQD